ncbi:MAG: aminotransferase class I/II-fold pyridoxal phosphate-dependent enzyme [Acidobacteria bacterium]|nr:aminotransferase class I/II-fold pyridoxal phosphate-dependent enzyme [Acidobacteriota bacterium]
MSVGDPAPRVRPSLPDPAAPSAIGLDPPHAQRRSPSASPRGVPPIGRDSTLGFSSLAIHAGERLGTPDVHPIATPIYTSVGFEAPRAADLDAIFAGTRPGFSYTRHGNPTCAALEETLTRLDQGAAAVTFGSGMAALHAAFLATELQAGDVIVSSRDIYGATHALFRDVFYTLGIETHHAEATNLDAFADTIRRRRPRVVFVETISNPLLRVADIPAIIEVARAAGAATVVDSTFTTPLLLKPILHGADFVVHSSTKYLNGHGDATGGAVVCREDAAAARVRHLAILLGSVLGPFEAYLTLRGIKTLAVRLPRQCHVAQVIAERLAAHPAIERVHYPGLRSHGDFEVASRVFEGSLYGAVVSFELRGAGREEVFEFMDRLRLCCVAPTVGDVYSQVLYPAIASHRDLTPRQREQLGIGDNLVRLSVGLEEPEDLIADLEQALGD